MSDNGGNRDMPEIRVTVNINGDDRDIVINLSDEAYRHLERLAKKRGKPMADIVVEALRLEQLLADRELLVRDKGAIRELVAVD